ncbi:hypothetical protein LCGC14_2939630, partial [marine sediment metagenome]
PLAMVIQQESVLVRDGILYFGLSAFGDRSGIYMLGQAAGGYGNAVSMVHGIPDTQPDGTAYIYSLASAGDNLYVSYINHLTAGSSNGTQNTVRLEGQNANVKYSNATYESIWVDADEPESTKEWSGFLLYAKDMPSSDCQIIVDARVDNSDNYSSDVSSITRSGATATVTMYNPHGFSTGYSIVISGADQSDYNGTYTMGISHWRRLLHHLQFKRCRSSHVTLFTRRRCTKNQAHRPGS